MVGFQRFLYLVGNHDWKNSPLMVNLNDEFTGKCLITGVNWSTCTGLCDVYIGTITHVQSILCIGTMYYVKSQGWEYRYLHVSESERKTFDINLYMKYQEINKQPLFYSWRLPGDPGQIPEGAFLTAPHVPVHSIWQTRLLLDQTRPLRPPTAATGCSSPRVTGCPQPTHTARGRQLQL